MLFSKVIKLDSEECKIDEGLRSMLFSKVIKLPFSNPVWVSSLRSMLFSKVIKQKTIIYSLV